MHSPIIVENRPACKIDLSDGSYTAVQRMILAKSNVDVIPAVLKTEVSIQNEMGKPTI